MPEAPEGPLDPLVASPAPSEATEQVEGRHRWLKFLPEIAVLGMCVTLWIPTKEFTSSVGGPGPALYPRSLIILLAITMVLRLAQQVRADLAGPTHAAVDREAPPEEGAELDAALIDNRRVMVAIGLSVLYVLSTLALGWLIATFIFTIVFLALAGKRNPLVVLPTALAFALGFSYVFVKLVYISLPTGTGVFDQITFRLFELMGIY